MFSATELSEDFWSTADSKHLLYLYGTAIWMFFFSGNLLYTFLGWWDTQNDIGDFHSFEFFWKFSTIRTILWTITRKITTKNASNKGTSLISMRVSHRHWKTKQVFVYRKQANKLSRMLLITNMTNVNMKLPPKPLNPSFLVYSRKQLKEVTDHYTTFKAIFKILVLYSIYKK